MLKVNTIVSMESIHAKMLSWNTEINNSAMKWTMTCLIFKSAHTVQSTSIQSTRHRIEVRSESQSRRGI